MVGQQLLAGGELLEGLGRVRVGARGRRRRTPGSRARRCRPARGRPTADDADVVEHGLAAVGGAAREVDLELAGQALGVGVVEEVRKVASAHGLMSSTSKGQAPARWQPVTLRTVSPHASRVVSPTLARSRSSSGTRSSWTKWNWMFCRVVMWPQPRL